MIDALSEKEIKVQSIRSCLFASMCALMMLVAAKASNAQESAGDWQGLLREAAAEAEAGDLHDAVELAEAAMNLVKAEVVVPGPEVAAGWMQLGDLYVKKGELDQAERAFVRALRMYEREAIPDHLAIADVQSRLIRVYRSNRAPLQAARAAKRRVDALKLHYGPVHPAVVDANFVLAQRYMFSGQYTKAEANFRATIAMYEASLGMEHPDVARSLLGLAAVKVHAHQLNEAVDYAEKARNVLEHVVGGEDPRLVNTLASLGSYYCALGDFATAEQLLVQSLSKMQTDSGRSEWAPDKTALVYNALRQAQGSRPENQYMWATGGLGNGRCHVFTLLF